MFIYLGGPEDLRKTLADCRWWGEVEDDLREENLISTHRFANKTTAREACMDDIENRRRQTVYPHPVCHPDCKARGIFGKMIHAIYVWDGVGTNILSIL